MTGSAPSVGLQPEPIVRYVAPPNPAPAVRLAALTKRFPTPFRLRDVWRGRHRGATTVVDHVTFDVAVGEIFGLLGPNGAGKTTIFKMLSTMVLPDEGTAIIRGDDIRDRPSAVRRHLAAVSSDERSLNWRLSALENLRLFAALHRVPQGEVEPRIARALTIVGLESAEGKMVAAFSSGMKQRLLIARALLAEPRVLLLDEPTRALDPISAQELRAFLRQQLVERLGCTIVLATHNTDEALGFCDRVAVLNRGRVLATGTASDLAARFGEEHYRILTTEPDHPSFARLEALGMLRQLGVEPRQSDNWYTLRCAIPGDPSRTARLLHLLHESGVHVARLERVEPSLADLIARIIAAKPDAPNDA